LTQIPAPFVCTHGTPPGLILIFVLFSFKIVRRDRLDVILNQEMPVTKTGPVRVKMLQPLNYTDILEQSHMMVHDCLFFLLLNSR